MDFKANFKIQKKFELCGESRFALTRLYLPIVGMDAFALYTFFTMLEVNETHGFKKVMDALGFPGFSFLESALHKLEGVGLMEKYYHEEKGYYFHISIPLDISSFFTYPVLEEFLVEKIGSLEVQKLKQQTTLKQPASFKNITKRFDEVYEKQERRIVHPFISRFYTKVKETIRLDPANFDYILFKMSFDIEMLDPNILDDEKLKQTILNLAFTYQFSEKEMQDVIIQTIQVEKDITFAGLKKHAKRVFDQKKQAPKEFVTKEPDIFTNSATDDETFQLLQLLESTEPSVLLGKYANMAPSSSELETIHLLMENTPFSYGMINLMILHVLQEKDGVLPKYAYFEKIANTWARKKIKTAKEALDLLNKENTDRMERKQNGYGYPKKERPEPTWYKEYEEELKKATKEPLTEEETKEALAKAKDLFK